jgi:hypothetical protein
MSQFNINNIYGSDGESTESEGNSSIMLFKEGVQWFSPSQKTPVNVRILPAFDFSLAGKDSEFKLSYVPYRIQADESVIENLDNETRTLKFSQWYATLNMYRWWGHNQVSFISPTIPGTRGGKSNWPAPGNDPIYDLWSYINKSGNPDLKHLITKPEGLKARCALEFPKTYVIMNTLVQDPKSFKWENKLCILTQASFGALKTHLCERSSKKEAVVSPNYPDFLIGDVTDPLTGSMGAVVSRRLGNSPMETQCIEFYDKGSRLASRRAMPVDPKTPEGKSYLEGRYNIGASLNLLSYAEIVKIVVESNEVPYDIVEAVCKDHCGSDMPPPPTGPTRVVVNKPKEGLQATTETQPAAPSSHQESVQRSLQPSAPAQPHNTTGSPSYNPQVTTGSPVLPQTPAVSDGSVPEALTTAISKNVAGIEMSKEEAQAAVDAFKQIVTAGINPTNYIGGIMAIQIKYGVN